MHLKHRVFLTAFIMLAGLSGRCQGTVDADFSAEIGQAGSLMFGGNNYGFSTQTISDEHHRAGFNAARYDALMNEIVPASTVADYHNNVGNIRDAAHWNWARIDHDLNMLDSSGFKTLLIIDYCPLWLTPLQGQKGNTINAVPSDWWVYEDIVSKVIAHVHKKVFALEVWNEPDLGLNITGSSYKARLSAYLDLYYHTSSAIRAVDKTIWIGGPAMGDTYDTTFLKAMLSDRRIAADFNFYSYHFYGFQKAGNITELKRIAAGAGKRDFPIVISEWNYSANFDKNPMNSDAVDAIAFVGNTLINQFKEQPYMSIMYCMDDFKKADNFFTMDVGGRFVPKVAVIKLLSVQLGLGVGDNKIFKTNATGGLNAVGAINAAHKLTVCIANAGSVSKAFSVKIKNAGINGFRTVEFLRVSAGNYDNLKPVKLNVHFINGSVTLLKLTLPANCVAGLLVL